MDCDPYLSPACCRFRPSQEMDDVANKVHGRVDTWIAEGAGCRDVHVDICWKYGISAATFYKNKARFRWLVVSDTLRLKVLGSDNFKLNELLAEAMLDNAIFKEVASRKW